MAMQSPEARAKWGAEHGYLVLIDPGFPTSLDVWHGMPVYGPDASAQWAAARRRELAEGSP